MCGGTLLHGQYTASVTGLSPRVRGNHVEHQLKQLRVGTIPACAGEPAATGVANKAIRDYPRVCGGTTHRAALASLGWGLSPRVRGNPSSMLLNRIGEGTIPACAGEPDQRSCVRHRFGDYPRVCGGTRLSSTRVDDDVGLSPRVRGNLW